ncbi:MAG: PEP-CTERM sorting domain-containing protein [Verrucomicrobiota bacterium]
MKRTRPYALLAAAALALAASAQAQYVNGDLLVGFTGGSQDFIYDLGQASSLTLGQTWNVGPNLGTQFGVLGAQSTGRHIYATSFDSLNENGYDPKGFFPNARAGITTIAGGLTAGSFRTTTPSDSTGWTFQTAQPAGTPGNTFQNDFFNPNVPVSAVAYLYDNLNTGTITPMSFLSYDGASGRLAYGVSAVPEPTTGSLFAALGLLAFAVRRQFSKA